MAGGAERGRVGAGDLLQLRVLLDRGRAAPLDPLLVAREVEPGDALDVGPHEHVAVAALLVERALHRQSHHLVQHVDDRSQLLAIDERIGDVTADDDVRAEGQRVRGRQVAGERPVDEEAAVQLDRLEGPRDPRARAERLGEHPFAEGHGLAGLDVGRHGDEGPRKPSNERIVAACQVERSASG